MLIYGQTNLHSVNNKIYSIEEIHKLFKRWKNQYWDKYLTEPHTLQKIKEDFNGFPVKVYSQRYELFLKSIKCVRCGLEANCYLLERQDSIKSNCCHFNLYYINKNKKVLFTKDHIYPKSKGGKNNIFNYQTMCYICNQEKADRQKDILEDGSVVYLESKPIKFVDPSGRNTDYLLNL